MEGASLLGSPRWTTIYRCKKHPLHEVVVNSIDAPYPERTFRVPGVGLSSFQAVSVTQLAEPKGGFKEMATKTKGKTKRSRKKKEDVEEQEQLEGLDDLEDDLEDLDEEEPEDVEEEEDGEEEKPKRKRSRSKKSSSKKGSRKGQAPPTRELPKGKYGAQEIAEIAGTDARAVRLFLRKKENKKKFPKDKELGRYAFTKKDATTIARAIKAASK